MAARSYLVIGGGLIGAASAFRLRQAGLDVTLIDPGDARRGASFGNIGHIAAEQTEPLASLRTLVTFPARLFAFGGPLDFRWRDVPLWGPWALRFVNACGRAHYERGCAALGALMAEPLAALTRLADDAGAPQAVLANGHAVVWSNAAAAKRGLAAWRAARLGSASFREMSGDDLAAYEGALARRPHAGIMFSGTGQVREPQALRDGVLGAFTRAGGRTVKAAALKLSVRESGVDAVLDTGETAEAEAVLIAAGAWSRALMKGLGLDVPLLAENGYSIQSTAHRWPMQLAPTVFEERALVVSRFSSGLRASSFLEIGAPGGGGDARKWRALQGHLRALGVAFSETPDRWRGPRPTLPDYLPAIGRLARAPRVLYAFGHQHLGLTLSAVTAELVAALAADEPPPIDLAPFRIERFA